MENILQRYLDMESSGIGYYFDADEIVELLDYFEDIEDFDNYKKAVKIGQKLHPHNTDIQICICKAYIYNNNFEKALALVEQLSNVGNRELKLLKCECLCALDRYEELTAFLETMRTDPDEKLQETYEYLAHLLHEQYESKNAYDLVKHGLSLFPNSVFLKEELCYHLDDLGYTETAIGVCKELIDYNPYCVDYWYLLGRLYAIMEAYDKAIEAFDFALISDETDMEIKILKAFCHFMNEDFEKVVEVYTDFFPAETKYIHDLIQSYINTSDESAYAYILLKKMIEKFDHLEIDRSLRFLLENQDDEEVNGLLSIADCFPGSLLFLLYKELLLMSEGEQNAIRNVEQIIHTIYQKGVNNENFLIDAKSKFCLSPKQKIEKLIATQTPDIESNEDGDFVVRQIIKHLLDGNISMFCHQYTQSSPEAISDYLEKIFPACKKINKQHTIYLRSDEIYRNEYNNISYDELMAMYMTNKNLHN